MATDFAPISISGGVNSQTSLNTNFTNLQTALGRLLNVYGDATTGTNTMQVDLDMNSNDILNAATVNCNDIVVGGTSLAAQVTAAAASAAAAATSETNAAASETAAAASAASITGLFPSKGDIIAGTGSGAVGTLSAAPANTYALLSNSAAATGLNWVALGSLAFDNGLTATDTDISTGENDYVNIAGSSVAAGPIISCAGSDTNINLQIQGKGTGYVDINSTISSGVRVQPAPVSGGVGIDIIGGSADVTISGYAPSGNDFGINIYTDLSGGSAVVDIQAALKIARVASVTNHLVIAGGTTGNTISLYPGSATDSNVDITLSGKGSGTLYATAGGNSAYALRVTAYSSSATQHVFRVDERTSLGVLGVDPYGNTYGGSPIGTTTMTDGFFFIPSCAGAPTGTPAHTPAVNHVPLHYDSTNKRLYVYSASAWHYVDLL